MRARQDTKVDAIAHVPLFWAASKSEGEAIAARLQAGTVNVDEGYALAFGSTAAPMGGMKASGIGRRHGADGILKYTESQTVSTARVLNLDPPLGISQTFWQKALTPMIQAVQKLPGRWRSLASRH